MAPGNVHLKTTFCVTRFSTHGPNLHSSMASMLACAACTRSLPAEQFVKAQVKKGPQKMRCKACVTAEAPLPVAVVPEAEAVSVAAPSDVDRSASQSVSHYHTPSREHMAHTLPYSHETGYGGYVWTKVKIE